MFAHHPTAASVGSRRRHVRCALLGVAAACALAPASAHAIPPVPPPSQTELFRINDTPPPGVLIQYRIDSSGTLTTRLLGYPGGVAAPEVNLLRQSTLRVTDYMCRVRRFCGRDGGVSLSQWRPFTLVAGAARSRFAAETGQAKVIRIQTGDAGAEDIVAHEFGHLMDKGTYAAGVRDPDQDLQGDEVEEALADMFAYDYDHDDPEIGENRAGRVVGFRNWQTPGLRRGDHDDNDATPAIRHPATMAQYRCDAREEHFNGTILSHGYWLFDQRVGRDVAGDVLHRVPARLSARPRYVEVMRAFRDVAFERHGAAAGQAAVDAFRNGAGVGDPAQDPAGC